jgi:hypothetical protein
MSGTGRFRVSYTRTEPLSTNVITMFTNNISR